MKAPARKTHHMLGARPDPIDRFIGKRLRERRVQQHFSQTALGKLIGVTYQSMQKYESGVNRMSANNLYRLGRALGVEPGYFFEGYPGPPSVAVKREKREKR
jgi:transcriptional regulator with XRE-family HTH domain